MSGDAIATLIAQLLPVIISALSPLVTALIERLTKATGNKLPDPAKPVINVTTGALVAASMGANPVVGMVGAMVGNRVRESINKKRKK